MQAHWGRAWEAAGQVGSWPGKGSEFPHAAGDRSSSAGRIQAALEAGARVTTGVGGGQATIVSVVSRRHTWWVCAFLTSQHTCLPMPMMR